MTQAKPVDQPRGASKDKSQSRLITDKGKSAKPTPPDDGIEKVVAFQPDTHPVGEAAFDVAIAFLRRALPCVGVGITLSLPGEQQGFFDLSTDDGVAEMAASMLMSPRGVDVYQACASFKSNRRKGDSARAMRALRVDIDIKPVAVAYAALGKFVAGSGMPRPSIVVCSGGGIHAYWTFTTDLDPVKWKRLALMLTSGMQASTRRFHPDTPDHHLCKRAALRTLWRERSAVSPGRFERKAVCRYAQVYPQLFLVLYCDSRRKAFSMAYRWSAP